MDGRGRSRTVEDGLGRSETDPSLAHSPRLIAHSSTHRLPSLFFYDNSWQLAGELTAVDGENAVHHHEVNSFAEAIGL